MIVLSFLNVCNTGRNSYIYHHKIIKETCGNVASFHVSAYFTVHMPCVFPHVSTRYKSFRPVNCDQENDSKLVVFARFLISLTPHYSGGLLQLRVTLLTSNSGGAYTFQYI